MSTFLDIILSGLYATCLDAELAAGVPPEASPRHAARARWLVAPRRRQILADGWERLLITARGPAGGLSARAPLLRERIRAAEPEIREMVGALRANGPIPAQGIAIATMLLTNGCGPIYNSHARDDIKGTIALALALLDPALPLSYETIPPARNGG